MSEGENGEVGRILVADDNRMNRMKLAQRSGRPGAMSICNASSVSSVAKPVTWTGWEYTTSAW